MSKISDALREEAMNRDFLSSSEARFVGLTGGSGIMRKPTRDWDEYLFACEAIITQMRRYENACAKRPAVIYATNELLCVLQQGHALVINAGKSDTFYGIPILPCGGSGRAFHFAAEVFELAGRSAE